MARIFISSTFNDLKTHRAAVIDGLKPIITVTEQVIVAMEARLEGKVAPEDRGLVEQCTKDVEACDVYVAIVAWRYGVRPKHGNPENLSITEIEHRVAVRRGLRRYYFLLDERAPWPMSLVDDYLAVDAFRRRLADERLVSYFNSVDDLSQRAIKTLWPDLVQHDHHAGHPWAEVLVPYLQETSRAVEAALSSAYGSHIKSAPADVVSGRVSEERARLLREGLRSEVCAEGRPLEELVEDLHSPCIWLIGDPGSGKSTLLFRTAFDAAQKALDAFAQGSDPRGPCIPILVRLADIAVAGDGDPIVSLFGETDALRRALREAATRGMVLFLLDGLDEVAPARRRDVERLLAALADKTYWTEAGSRVVLTSRPSGYVVPRDQLSGLGRFKVFGLLPLDSQHRTKMLGHWSRLSQLDQEGAGRLLALLEAKAPKGLLGNPLMLRLMAELFGVHPAELPVVEVPQTRMSLLGWWVQGAATKFCSICGDSTAQADVVGFLAELAANLQEVECSPFSEQVLMKAMQASPLAQKLLPSKAIGSFERLLAQLVNVGALLNGPGTRYRFPENLVCEHLVAQRWRESWSAVREDIRNTASKPEYLPRAATPLLLLIEECQDANNMILFLRTINDSLAREALRFTRWGAISASTLLRIAPVRPGRDSYTHRPLSASEAGEAKGQVADLLRLSFRCDAIGRIVETAGPTSLAVEALRRSRRETSHGAELYSIREALVRIAKIGDQDVRSAAEAELSDIFDHLKTPPPFVEKAQHGNFWLEVPDHDRTFWISRIPISNRLYEQFDPVHSEDRYGDEGVEFDDSPVRNVNRFEADTFCRWLSQEKGAVALPLSWQWQAALRLEAFETTPNLLEWCADAQLTLDESVCVEAVNGRCKTVPLNSASRNSEIGFRCVLSRPPKDS